ncbi:MAG: hypothetical protein PHX51_05070 [Clostridia bacterium]|nr:hypothetical protein [Clostridia bacterium]
MPIFTNKYNVKQFEKRWLTDYSGGVRAAVTELPTPDYRFMRNFFVDDGKLVDAVGLTAAEFSYTSGGVESTCSLVAAGNIDRLFFHSSEDKEFLFALSSGQLYCADLSVPQNGFQAVVGAVFGGDVRYADLISDGVDYAAFYSEEDDLFLFHDLNTQTFSVVTPERYSALLSKEGMLYAAAGHMLYYSSQTDIANWGQTLPYSVRLNEYGKIIRLASCADGVLVFCVNGIYKVRARSGYALSVTKLFSSTATIFADSIKEVNDRVYFANKISCFYIENGVELAFSFKEATQKPVKNLRGCALENGYLLLFEGVSAIDDAFARLNHSDNVDSWERYIADRIPTVTMGVFIDSKPHLIEDIPVKTLCCIHSSAFSGAIGVQSGDRTKLAHIDFCGKILDEPLSKVWISPKLYPGLNGKNIYLKSFELSFCSDIKLTVLSDREKTVKNVRASDRPISVPLNMIGKEFCFIIECEGKARIGLSAIYYK